MSSFKNKQVFNAIGWKLHCYACIQLYFRIQSRFIKTVKLINGKGMQSGIASISGVSAFGRIDWEIQIYRPIPDIVNIFLQTVAVWTWWDQLDVIGEKQHCHIDDVTLRTLTNNMYRGGPTTDPWGTPLFIFVSCDNAMATWTRDYPWGINHTNVHYSTFLPRSIFFIIGFLMLLISFLLLTCMQRTKHRSTRKVWSWP